MDSAKTIKALTDCDAISAALRKEHQAIEDGLQTLDEAMRAGAGPDVLVQILDIIVDFCVAHFGSEEQEFHNHGYVDVDLHAKAHEVLLRGFRAARDAISKGQLEATLDASDLLNSFHNHVTRFDCPAHVQLLKQQIKGGGDTLHHQIELHAIYRVSERTAE